MLLLLGRRVFPFGLCSAGIVQPNRTTAECCVSTSRNCVGKATPASFSAAAISAPEAGGAIVSGSTSHPRRREGFHAPPVLLPLVPEILGHGVS